MLQEIQNRVDRSSEDLRVRLDKRRHKIHTSDVNRNDAGPIEAQRKDGRKSDPHRDTSRSVAEREAPRSVTEREASRVDAHPKSTSTSPQVKMIKIDEKEKDPIVSFNVYAIS